MANPAVVAAQGPAPGSVPEFLFLLITILVSAKVLGELAERVGQPAVLGELLAGVIVGGSVLGLVDPGVEMIHLLAEIGVIVLLFEIGLETDLGQLVKVGGASSAVAAVGVIVPFVLGYMVSTALGLAQLPAIVAGAALTATSVGITARVLSDLGRLQEAESRIILGAAVIDDVVGLIILSVVAGLVAGDEVTVGGVAKVTGLAFGFIVGALIVGRLVVPPVFGLLERLGRNETVAAMALVLALLLAYLADTAGSAMIIGAFTAGVLLEPTPQSAKIEEGVVRLGHFFVPIFFVSVGAAVDVRTFGQLDVAVVGLALIVVAVLGKFVAGYAPFWFKGKKSVIGVGMIPRGEVGLIFAQLGLTSGVLTVGEFSALTLMVIVTTFMAPPLLKVLFPRKGRGGPPERIGIAGLTTEA
ncbi:MAG TPA: cation:proton antiporter [Longimicrobiales bacterium]